MDNLKLSSVVLELVTAIWFFVLGASFGSFLNVVIYRVPLGMTLLGHSICPQCRSQILFRDNIPIVSWLMLQGRCRQCKCQIPNRYWLIELLVGLLVLSLAIAEVAGGGINLPITPSHYRGFALNSFGQRPDFFVWMIAHSVLLTTLLALRWIEKDGQPPPFALAVVAGVAILALAWQFPSRDEVPLYAGQTVALQSPVGYGLLSAAVAASLGWALSAMSGRKAAGRDCRHWIAAFGLCGAALGVAPLVGITIFAMPLLRGHSVGAILIAAGIHILFWRPIHAVEYLGDPNRHTYVFVMVLVLLVIAWGAVQVMIPAKESQISPPRQL